jgi:hypothetical protein
MIILECVKIGHDEDADADKETKSSKADNGSAQNVEDRRHSTRECEEWKVYFRHVRYNNSAAKATGSYESEVQTVS